jgi:predicted AAA+ superfamily ATPase
MVDTSFPTALNTISGEDLGWKLENVVFLELLRKRYENNYFIHFYRSHFEIDFVLSAGLRVTELIQVCADISAKKTFNRETNALINGAKLLNCNKLTLITMNDSRKIELDGFEINCVTLFEWLYRVSNKI